ncbi:MAG: saccharopine dehydrogenase NADP-binding domain-containing protein [Myxococcales bacterium]|nr:saccharopine dehydrogenase NADP-binding domain-containing protein [Myxococcales bacterium]
MAKKTTYDVVVYGATGFTGRLVAEYLAATYGIGQKSLKWAIAGRSEQKLKAVKIRLKAITSEADALPVIVADSSDRDSLRAMAEQTKVVCTTVGPFAKYGLPVVEACANAGAHYCDITGEATFVAKAIELYHALAESNSARIVTCCGYDSIPSDLGCYLLQQTAIERFGKPCTTVQSFAGKVKGGFSGGTLASIETMMEQAKADRSLWKVIGDPYSLNPAGAPRGEDGPDQRGVSYNKAIGQWTAPFLMAGINTRVVRRSNALLDFAYGEDFRFSESMACGGGPKGAVRAAAVTAGLMGLLTVMMSKTGRKLAGRVFPDPGEGPNAELREAGYFNHHLVGDGPGSVSVNVHGDKDPGYGSTSMMLAECAVSLAKDQAKLPKRFGILTPASALGQPLIDRLNEHGMSFTAT